MRHRLLIALLALAVVGATAAWFLAGKEPVVTADDQAPPAAERTADADTGIVKSLPETALGGVSEGMPSAAIAASKGIIVPDEATPQTPEEKREAYVAKRVAELQDLGMEDDLASLEAILSDLTSSEPDIRRAAVDAAVQFGSRDAIPRLLDVAARADDPEEKSSILEAVEFLKMPTLAEALAQTNRPAPPASSSTRSNP